MSLPIYTRMRAWVDGHGAMLRRDFLGTLAWGGAAGFGLADWLVLNADELRARGAACILLWMQGGASQLETWDPKPGHENGGETQSIQTDVAGIDIANSMPEMAKITHEVCVMRSITSREGNHPRATHLMQTSYLPNAAIKHPSIGAIAARQWEDRASDLPGFVEIGDVKGRGATGGGFLGVSFEPFFVQDASRPPNNTTLAVNSNRLLRRMDLLNKLEQDANQESARREREAHRQVYEKATKLVLSPSMKAFQLSSESDQTRQMYGKTPFGNGCLLARRLVETGVTFVKVNLGDWDTHADNFKRSNDLSQQFDRPFASLISDLRQRGLLDKTLIVWMGEFGRTPKINAQAGRDHHPKAFSVVLAGGGIKGGQVIGATSEDGEEVKDRPIKVSDLICTMCSSLKIDPTKENASNADRPVRTVDGGEAVREAFA